MKKFLVANINIFDDFAPIFIAIYGLILYVFTFVLSVMINSVLPLLIAIVITVIAIKDSISLIKTCSVKNMLSISYGVNMSDIDYDSSSNKGAVIHIPNQDNIYIKKKSLKHMPKL